jgi:proteic killer suppression protein
MERELGSVGARQLQNRLAELFAARHVRELVAGRPHPLHGDRAGQFSLTIKGGKRLVFEPLNDPIPILPSGGIDWQKVTEIKIIFIGDYHD